jgi:arsenate reductase (thioredoxin)
MFPRLEETIIALPRAINDQRKIVLFPLVNYIDTQLTNKAPIRLNFICTHNSRRSHFAQIWAQTMASFFRINNIACYSGGTEATSIYKSVRLTLVQQGFELEKISEGHNPIYSIKYGAVDQPLIAFSKRFDHPFNPSSNFAAIMTCSSADEACPVVLGAQKRIAIRYEDPKVFDNTPNEQEKYLERSKEIAQEMYWVFSQIGNKG